MRLSWILLQLLPGFAPATSLLDAALNASRPGEWLTWRVDAVEALDGRCCIDTSATGPDNGHCDLSAADWHFLQRAGSLPHSSNTLRLFVQRTSGGIGRVLAVDATCRVDVTSAPQDLGRVDALESVRILDRGRARWTAEQASSRLSAIALHAGAAPDAVLEEALEGPEWMQRDAAFWLGRARGEIGRATLVSVLESHPDASLARAAVFALSLSPLPRARADLQRFAGSDLPASARGEALLWLALAGDGEVEALARMLLVPSADGVDPGAVVFALSRLPRERSLAALRSLLEPEVDRPIRRQALFWLGQSEDPAALALIENLLRAPHPP